ncbi:ATP-dependent Clp protease ATP-binding subunit CLPT1, chloroplastic isoform X2 [Physcomitrium patens]|uniref:Clp R domain-containing protein n=1 Tax=Physcomitrium patens TaxID=3218 RepID=A0A7I4FFS1_PHYPA|nr:ATP-dependent Clp protease ATP-binding subunit CLPT1, chloroplastic-like isoform X2 [Physcomitrium patens]|eukprot:XP_024360274.1 ATP-dependent Clp protease ATP-binding subunit CLPT1, chloroplastic-like isoform X2 [Physcomitrella patens]
MASSLLRTCCCTPSTAAAAAAPLAEPRRGATASNVAVRLSQLCSELRWSGGHPTSLFLNRGYTARDSRRQKRFSAVCMVLPAGDTQVESPKVNWESRAVKSFSMSELEARKLRYPNTGTESILLGILTEGTSEAARYLRKNGVTLFGAKEEIIKLLGKADMYYFSPEHPPLTDSAQKALEWAVDPKNIPEGVSDRELSTTMLVLGIWAQKGSGGQKVLEKLGINDEKIAELAATMKNSPASNYQQLVK